MPAWYIIDSQMLPCGSNSRSSPPLGCSGLSTGIGISFTAPVLGSSTPTNWWPKSEYQALPSASTITSCGCASLRGRSYSVTMTRVARPFGRGSGLNWYSRRLGIAEREAREIFRRGLGGIAGDGGALAARPRQQRLRMGRGRARRIARHAQEHLLELGRAVRRRQHPLQGVAADAHGEECLLPGLARQAVEPFAARQLRDEILDRAELEIGGGGRAGRDVGALRAVELVADRADRDRVAARLEPIGREAVAALLVGNDGDRDGRSAFFALTRTPSIAGSAADET